MPHLNDEDNSSSLKRLSILIWPASESIEKEKTQKQGRMRNVIHFFRSQGHAALRTFKGGSNGEGIYVSFWPGLCEKRNESNSDPLLCRKNKAHFHTRSEDDLTYGPHSPDPIVITLFVSSENQEKIHAAFRTLHNNQMFSIKPWGY